LEPLLTEIVILSNRSAAIDMERAMPATAMEVKVRQIITDGRLPRSRKLDELRKLHSETSGIQRPRRLIPATIDDGLQDDLRVVEEALRELGDDAEKGIFRI
jgi:hypothetical protein